jgi:hypothetical protein
VSGRDCRHQGLDADDIDDAHGNALPDRLEREAGRNVEVMWLLGRLQAGVFTQLV